ncbi:MAG: glycine cleavage system aminomethyltransferase GcvT [Pseudomonadota bacterium]|nr:glycine cleavage system aminomethyltransferase GcvT [Pseudomonadota bacterium]
MTTALPLFALHNELSATFAPFAGWNMPINYASGILAEHRQVRAAAGLFDISHMGRLDLQGAHVCTALEVLVPSDLATLTPGRMRYTVLTTPSGGVLDDIMVTRFDKDRWELVVNASRIQADAAHLRASGLVFKERSGVLLAFQGPKAMTILARHIPRAADLRFMSAIEQDGLRASRCGYTGEDGFEIAIDDVAQADDLARALLAEPEVAPVGLGARDTLRLEAGLCLYGHDIDTETSPIEAGLDFVIGKRRREQGGFPGAARILRELAQGPSRKRVGLIVEDGPPARQGASIAANGKMVGRVTSGGVSPSLGVNIAMGHVPADLAAPGTALELVVRGRGRSAKVVPLPFVPHSYHTGG